LIQTKKEQHIKQPDNLVVEANWSNNDISLGMENGCC
jgi:hypothetical protein